MENKMACIYVCDGCGKKAKGVKVGTNWRKPYSWFQRGDEDGIQDACSRKCIEKIAEETGKTGVILPV
jgi:hypothetical protein